MNHRVKFERFDFSKTPAPREERTVEIEFPKVTDENIEQYEEELWNALFALPDTGAKGHFSSWLIANKDTE